MRKIINLIWIILLFSFIFCETGLPQSQSEYALIQIPVLITSNPPDTVWEMNKSDASSRLGTQLFIDQVSAALSFVMTPPPSYQLWSGVSFHLDNGWNRVVYFECMDSWIRAFGDRGSGTGEFLWPSRIDAHALCGYCGSYWCYSDFHYIYVADASNNRIVELRYDYDNKVIELLESFIGGGLDLPKDLDINNGGTFAFNDNDYLWVVNGQQIKRFTIDGVLRNTYGYYDCNPSGVGNFCRPTAVACGRSKWMESSDYDMYANDNQIYVADNGNHRLVLMEKDSLSENITWIKTLSIPSEADIVDLEVDNFGQVWAVDKINGRIYKYTSDLYPLCYFGSFGTGMGQFNYPGSISNSGGYLGGGGIYVTESWTDSSGGQYFYIGTDIVDFEVTSSVDYRWHYINYTLVDPSDMTIEIYDEEDQLVKTLFNEREYSGACIHVWDGTDQSGQPVGTGSYRVVVTDSSAYMHIETENSINVVVKEAWLHHEYDSITTPWDLTSYQSGPDEITLDWLYTIPYPLDLKFTIYCDGCLCGANTTAHYWDSDLIPDRNYVYWVKAFTQSTESDPSNTDTVFLESKHLSAAVTDILPSDYSSIEPIPAPKQQDSADVAVIYTTPYPGHFCEVELKLKNPMPISGFNLLIKLNGSQSNSNPSLIDFHTNEISKDSILIGSDWVHYPVRECFIDTTGSLISDFNSLTCRGQVADTSSSHCKYLWVKAWASPEGCIEPSNDYRTLFKFGADVACIPESTFARKVSFDLDFCLLYNLEYEVIPIRYHKGDLRVLWTVPGDANNDNTVDVGDVVYMIDFLFNYGPPSCVPETADPNGDAGDNCEPDVSDITYLIMYLYRGGPAPIWGCWLAKDRK